MKKIIFVLFVLLAFNFVISAQNVKVGVVNVYFIFDKVAEKELRGFVQSKQNEINLMTTRYERELKYFRENANSMSDDARRTKGDELERLRVQIRRKTEDAQRMIEGRRNRLKNIVIDRVLNFSREIGSEKGLEMVFSSDRPPMFKSDRITIVNITEDVLRRF